MTQSPGSHSSGSTQSDEDASGSHYQARSLPPGLQRDSNMAGVPEEEPESNSEEEETEDEANALPNQSQYIRPQSSLSSHHYRTPMAGSIMTPPPVGFPAAQQPSGYETPSAFAEPQASSYPASSYPAQGSYAGQYSEHTISPQTFPTPPGFKEQPQQISVRSYAPPARPASRPALESAIENVQAHIAALNERLESLESISGHPHRSNSSLPTHSDGRRGGSPDRRGDYEWDLDDLGMWSLVLSPVTRVGATIRQVTKFFATSEHSPTLIVVRRLCLDMSFIFCVLWIMRLLWRKTGVRRREVRLALKILGRALIGRQQERALIDRGV